MKKIWMFLLIIFIGVFALNVYAGPDDEPDPDDQTGTSTPAWPKEYTYKDYKTTITGVVLNVYKLDATKTVETTTQTDHGTTTVSKNEDFEKYVNEQPTRVITLDPTKYTLNPQFKEDTIADYNAVFVDLNLNLTKEKLEELLETEINSASEDITYIVDVVVKFKMDNYPEKYNSFRRFSTFRDLLNTVFGETGTEMTTDEIYNPNINIENETSQVLNMAMIGVMEEGKNPGLYYETNLSNNDDWMYYVNNYTILSEIDLTNNSFSDESNKDKVLLLMHHDLEDIDTYINYMKNTTSYYDEDEFNEMIDKLMVEQQVEVPNTALSKNKLWAMIGTISILTGLMLIGYTLKMIQFRKIRKQETI